MKLGIGTYCYMWAIGFKFGDKEARPAHPMTALGLLQRAVELGVRLVQYGPNLSLSALSRPELEELIACARQWHIELEVGTRGLAAEHLRQQVEIARLTGSKLIRTIPEIGGKPIAAKDVPHYLKQIVPLLEKEGIKLGLENGQIPAKELARALDEVRSPLLGVVLDTANSLAISEGWHYVAEILAPYTICLHHKEFIVQRVWTMMGFTVEGRRADSIALEDRWVRASVPYLRQFVVE